MKSRKRFEKKTNLDTASPLMNKKDLFLFTPWYMLDVLAVKVYSKYILNLKAYFYESIVGCAYTFNSTRSLVLMNKGIILKVEDNVNVLFLSIKDLIVFYGFASLKGLNEQGAFFIFKDLFSRFILFCSGLSLLGVFRSNPIRYNYNSLFRLDRLKLPKKIFWVSKSVYEYFLLFRRLYEVSIFGAQRRVLSEHIYSPLLLISKTTRYRVLLTRTLNNVFLTCVNLLDNHVISYVSSGLCGLHGARKSSHIAAEKVAVTLSRKLLNKGITVVDFVICTPIIDAFVKSVIQNLLVSKRRYIVRELRGRNVVGLQSLVIKNLIFSPIKTHNGIRLRKSRRV